MFDSFGYQLFFFHYRKWRCVTIPRNLSFSWHCCLLLLLLLLFLLRLFFTPTLLGTGGTLPSSTLGNDSWFFRRCFLSLSLWLVVVALVGCWCALMRSSSSVSQRWIEAFLVLYPKIVSSNHIILFQVCIHVSNQNNLSWIHFSTLTPPLSIRDTANEQMVEPGFCS